MINGDPSISASHVLSVAFPPVRAETLLHALEGDGIIVGNGSACSAKKAKYSDVLTAMHARNDVMESTIRISLSHTNTMEEMDYTAQKIVEKVRMLRKFIRR